MSEITSLIRNFKCSAKTKKRDSAGDKGQPSRSNLHRKPAQFCAKKTELALHLAMYRLNTPASSAYTLIYAPHKMYLIAKNLKFNSLIEAFVIA